MVSGNRCLIWRYWRRMGAMSRAGAAGFGSTVSISDAALVRAANLKAHSLQAGRRPAGVNGCR
jgi:hypothetical protein